MWTLVFKSIIYNIKSKTRKLNEVSRLVKGFIQLNSCHVIIISIRKEQMGSLYLFAYHLEVVILNTNGVVVLRLEVNRVVLTSKHSHLNYQHNLF